MTTTIFFCVCVIVVGVCDMSVKALLIALVHIILWLIIMLWMW